MREDSFRELADHAAYGIEICRIVMDDGVPVDVMVEYTNDAGKLSVRRYLGLADDAPLGHSISSFIKDEDGWLERCYDIGYLDKPLHWTWKNSRTRHWIDIFGTPLDEPGLFGLTIIDTTQSHEERAHAFSDLNISAAILQCAQIFQSDLPFTEAAYRSFTEMAVLLHPDRIYLGEIHGNKVSLVVQWNAQNGSQDIKPFQDMDISAIEWWKPHLDADGTMIVEDMSLLDPEKDATGIRIARSFGIERFMVTMICQHGETIGYLGVDNYRPNKYIDTRELLEAVAFFAGTEMHNRILQERLTRLSRFDELTGLSNRNAYDSDIAKLMTKADPVGFIFCDLNGLKQMNDEHGHNAGDELLKCCAQALSTSFTGMRPYRVGGDEFMVVAEGYGQERFEQEYMAGLARLRSRSGLSISVGHAWAASGDSIPEARKLADTLMYIEKAAYYRTHDRRRR